MRVDLKISGKNQGNPLNLEKIREKSGKLLSPKMNSSCCILKENVLDIGLKAYILTDVKGFSKHSFEASKHNCIGNVTLFKRCQ